MKITIRIPPEEAAAPMTAASGKLALFSVVGAGVVVVVVVVVVVAIVVVVVAVSFTTKYSMATKLQLSMLPNTDGSTTATAVEVASSKEESCMTFLFPNLVQCNLFACYVHEQKEYAPCLAGRVQPKHFDDCHILLLLEQTPPWSHAEDMAQQKSPVYHSITVKKTVFKKCDLITVKKTT